MEVRVDMDVTELKAVLAALVSPRLERAATAALNDTAKNAQVQGVKLLAPLLDLPSKVVKDSVGLGPAATPSRLEASVVCQGRPIPLIQFKVRDTKRTGVIARVAKEQRTYPSAFIATVRGRKRGVFERVGRARFPVRELFGPSAAALFARPDVLGVVTQTMNQKLPQNLARQVDRQMRAARGVAGSRAQRGLAGGGG